MTLCLVESNKYPVVACISSTTYFPSGRLVISANPLLSVVILATTCPFV